jgi:(2Fe-2S) ferredoxin
VFARIKDVLGGDPDFNVRGFECLGACEIAPMASVDGVYVGPLTEADAERIRDDVKEGRPVLADKQLAKRKAASKHWRETQQ